ncbi:MAG: DUF3368 domain-containing protein [Spirochaetaceae bacterium]|nr:DUF3368 domain-containing protein [Spirochaetaceae bacterium]
MIVVSDTTPLISLLKIHRLDLLKSLFDEVQIPQGVFDELTANQNYYEEAEKIKNCSFVTIKSVDSKQVSLFQRVTGLDLGESEAIVLTDTIKADLILLDEIHARQVAKNIGINIMGTVGILKTAYNHGLITAEEIRSAVEIFRSNGRHISENLLSILLNSL